MTSVRKRKMKRSSVLKATRRLKDRHLKITVRGSKLIAENWDHNATLAQNYERLGLAVKLEKPAGGTEKKFTPEKFEDVSESENEENPVAVAQDDPELPDDPAKIPKGQAKIVRDKDGKIVRVIEGTYEEDPEDRVVEPVKPKTKIVEELEKLASRPVETRKKHQTERERDWLGVLYRKYGEDYEKMKWDMKLNPYQHTPAQLKKKITKWKKEVGMV